MQIQISEVWNREGKSKVLAVIENGYVAPNLAVWDWIHANRPDLDLAGIVNDHGFHAVAI